MSGIEKVSRLVLRSLHSPTWSGNVISESSLVASLASSFHWYGTHSKDTKKKKKTTKKKSNAKTPASTSPGMEDRPPAVYTYEGPFSNAVKKVKHLSLFSCFVTLSSCPVMLLLDPATLVEGAAATSMTARMSLAATLSTFGLGTTGLLHWFTYPYVHRLVYDGKGLDIETATFLAKKQIDRVPLEEIEAGAPGSMHPLSTFKASGKIFYLDKEYFYDKKLLLLLAGEDPSDDPNHQNYQDT